MDNELVVVPDFAAAEAAVRKGTDSSRLVVLAGQAEEAALQAARAGIAGGRGPLPSTPHSMGKRCLVVLPTYNEAENVEAVSRAIRNYLDTDVLIVDDDSPDGTGRIADELAAEDSRIRVLHRPGKQGLGTAYLAGFARAVEEGYERVFEMDADFSHPPWDLPRLAAASLDADLVIGSRYVTGGDTQGWDLKRRMLSRGANFYARACLTARIRDLTGGFRAYDVDCLRRLDLSGVSAQGYAFQIEMAYRMLVAGFRVIELPIHFVDRRVGASKMDGRVAREAIVLVPRLRFKVRPGNVLLPTP